MIGLGAAQVYEAKEESKGEGDVGQENEEEGEFFAGQAIGNDVTWKIWNEL